MPEACACQTLKAVSSLYHCGPIPPCPPHVLCCSIELQLLEGACVELPHVGGQAALPPRRMKLDLQRLVQVCATGRVAASGLQAADGAVVAALESGAHAGADPSGVPSCAPPAGHGAAGTWASAGQPAAGHVQHLPPLGAGDGAAGGGRCQQMLRQRLGGEQRLEQVTHGMPWLCWCLCDGSKNDLLWPHARECLMADPATLPPPGRRRPQRSGASFASAARRGALIPRRQLAWSPVTAWCSRCWR